MPQPTIPEYLATCAHRYHPAIATTWLTTALPTVNEIATRWGVTLTGESTSGASALIVYGHQHDRDVVIKLPIIANRSVDEAAALATWAPTQPTPRLYNHDHNTGALLLERIHGVNPASPDPRAVGNLIHRLAAPTPHSLTIAAFTQNVTARLAATTTWGSTRVADLVPQATRLAQELTATCTPSLVHGDLQNKNLLVDAHDILTAIDPVPGAGDPTFDVALWAITNTSERHILDDLTACSEAAHANPERAIAWAQVVAICEHRGTRHPGIAARCDELLAAHPLR